MKEKPLFPTYAKAHAPAKTLAQAKASLKSLLSYEDIEYLVEHEGDPPRWAAIGAERAWLTLPYLCRAITRSTEAPHSVVTFSSVIGDRKVRVA